jgi:hypothetical protein
MGASLQVINLFTQGLVGKGFEALGVGTGDSLTFQNVPQTSKSFLAEVWAVDDATTAELAFFASRWHDQQFGIRMEVPDGTTTAPVNRPFNVLPDGLDQPIFPSDVLNPLVNGTTGDNVNATCLVYYSDLPGISARLASASYVKANTKNLVGINVAVTTGSGDYGATAALNSSDNRLHANTDYAVVGFTTDIPTSLIALQGVDTGNQRVGGPTIGDAERDARMFLELSRKFGDAPLVPIVNSNNAGAILLSGAATTGAATAVDVMMVELTGPFSG